MKTVSTFGLASLALCYTCALVAAPVYNIVPLGLGDLEHTGDDGSIYSAIQLANNAGHIVGDSPRYSGGSSVWLYDGASTIKIGLVGAEHTRLDGFKYSNPASLNDAGQVIGHSNRYNGGDIDLGLSAWFFDGDATIDIGLVGIEHTKNDGYKFSEARRLNDAGQVIGYSKRYNGGDTDMGRSAWLYNGPTTIDIGLTGPEYTRDDGYKFHGVRELNEAGQVTGSSGRYSGHDNLGVANWLYNGTAIVVIGLTGSEHTRSDGYKFSADQQLNEAGQAIGYSYRYNGGIAFLGRSAWLYDGATTIDIGLTGTEHSIGGYKNSVAQKLNEAGHVIGYSERPHPNRNLTRGQSAWLYDGATTINIGLTGPEYTRADTFKYSSAVQMNEAGQVIGRSERFNSDGMRLLGFTAWLYDGASTIEIGLIGAEHTSDRGFQDSNAIEVNETGQVRGTSARFNGGPTRSGQTSWFYDGAAMTKIGLVGSEYTRSNGEELSFTRKLNEAGQVIGGSFRFNGNAYSGFDAWLYDPALNQTISLQLSKTSTGFADSSAEYLGEDGLILGTYTLFDTQDNRIGPRAFYFTIADGLHDLGSLVNGGLTANDWDYLANAIRANGRGQILGHGKLTSQTNGRMAYLLTPVIPEPTSSVLAIFASLGLLARRRM